MTLYGDNYAFDFYTWAHDIQCAERVAARLIKKTSQKELIKKAFETKNFTNYPDSDSHMSIDTLEFNEIHSYTSEIGPNEIGPNALPKNKKIKCCSIL